MRGVFGTKVRGDPSQIYSIVGHENGIPLYSSKQAGYVIKSRRYDYYTFAVFAAWISGLNQLMVLPFAIMMCSMPRRISYVKHFTYHAELLPHTEQVVFHKVTMFGEMVRIYVDIKNLEKIVAEECGTPLLWDMNLFDDKMVFRCTESDQKFVFDKQGVWN